MEVEGEMETEEGEMKEGGEKVEEKLRHEEEGKAGGGGGAEERGRWWRSWRKTMRWRDRWMREGIEGGG